MIENNSETVAKVDQEVTITIVEDLPNFNAKALAASPLLAEANKRLKKMKSLPK